jgi:Heterokaryon incompatibility protein (HET)
MRLLNARTIQLEEFFNAKTRPSYAILSHTWKEGAEVTFDDMQKGLGRDRSGFTKIRYTCEQALQDGYLYAWVDTCCIDKSSSSELSEAINSMFQWYREAGICYAYLEDVSVKDMEDCHVPDDDHMLEHELEAFYESKIAKTRWFKRGWTLQELIAPSKLDFYGTNWSRLGSSIDLLGAVVMLTSIDQNVLSCEPSLKMDYLQRCSVAQRLSWAARRETTRKEDIAYCLMGIFDVNMPLLYGEGEYAFIRLQEEIIRNSSDQSIFAWDRRGNATKLLAPDPACFQHCGTVTQWPREGPRESYSMTNAGLSISLPLLTRTNRAVLACRFSDHVDGIIALDLEAVGSRKEGVPSYVISQVRLARRGICLISAERAEHARKTMTQIVILRDELPDTQMPLRQNHLDTFKIEHPSAFVLRYDYLKVIRPAQPKVMIKAFYPSRHWREVGDQYAPDNVLLLPSRLSAGAVRFSYNDKPFIVAFGLKKRKFHREQVDAWISIQDAENDLSVREIMLNKQKVFETAFSNKVIFRKFPNEKIEISIVKNTTLGDPVFEIWFTVSSTIFFPSAEMLVRMDARNNVQQTVVYRDSLRMEHTEHWEKKERGDREQT